MRLPLLIALSLPLASLAAEPAALTLRLTAGGREEVRTVPRIALNVSRGAAVSPRLPAGAFSAKWEGSLAAAKRGEYVFTVKVRGGFKLWIDGRLEMEGAGTGMAHPMDKTLWFEAGAHRLLAEFSADGAEDALIELDWKPR